jgi:hypothetical protein
VSMFPTALNAQEREIHEQEVRECVYYLGGIWCRVVVLSDAFQ